MEGEIMARIKKVAVTGLLAFGLVASAAGLASADIVEETPDEGGIWRWGTTTSTTQSHYHNNSVCHGATASGETIVRDEAAAGSWARANAKRASTNNEAFYSAEC